MAEFTKQELKALRAQLDAELAGVSERLGVEITLKNCSYLDDRATWKLETAKRGALSKEASAFQRHAELFGVEASDLGRHVKVGGIEYTVDGLSLRGTRPFIFRRVSNGKAYAFTRQAGLTAILQGRTIIAA